MAYQNVGTPRFYVSILQWLSSLGKLIIEDTPVYQLSDSGIPPVYINPTSQAIFQSAEPVVNIALLSKGGAFAALMPEKKNFWMVLGHTLTGVRCYGRSEDFSPVADGDLINFNSQTPEYNGFSIGIGNDATDVSTNRLLVTFANYSTNTPYKLGSVLYGTYYDMPNTPNLSLKMSREYGSTKESATINGSSVSNTMSSKPPKWGDLGAWELDGILGSGDQAKDVSRSGRKIWGLKFSFMSDGDLWSSNQMLNRYRTDISDGIDNDDLAVALSFNYNLLTDDNFFSQVWHKTLGGTLPFIFQPDNSNNNPDQFAICRFVDGSLKATQSAFNVYDISLSIEEVW